MMNCSSSVEKDVSPNWDVVLDEIQSKKENKNWSEKAIIESTRAACKLFEDDLNAESLQGLQSFHFKDIKFQSCNMCFLIVRFM